MSSSRRSIGIPVFAVIIVFCFALGCASGSGSSEDSTSRSDHPNATQPLTATGRALQFCQTKSPDSTTMERLARLFKDFGTNDYKVLKAAEGLPFSASEIEVPVHFHIISKGPSLEEGEVPDSAILEQINVLNEAYSGRTGGVPTPFRFTLAGINRVRNPEWHTMSPGSKSELDAKPALKTGGAGTLNVYSVDIGTSEGGQILGYSTLPIFYGLLAPYDGIVMNFRTFPGGTIDRYNIGHVLVHETGHWLGLMHTFQGECDGMFDDLVADTPREKIPTKGEFCPIGRKSCPEQPGNDPIHNHMTYTEDGCRFEFTPGQVQFMRFNTVVFRLMFS